METVIHTTAVLSNRGYYDHFGICINSAKLYGIDPNNIENVTLEISEDQSPPNSKKQEYWGWYDCDKEKWTLIFPNWLLLHVCFPYGLPKHEEVGDGKAYRLNLVK